MKKKKNTGTKLDFQMYTSGTGLPPAPPPTSYTHTHTHTHTHIFHGSFIKFVFIIDKYFLLPFYNVQLEDRPQAKY